MKKVKQVRALLLRHLGQNYAFDGCMAYLMECINEKPEYDYWFFSDVTGDSFTQVYSDELVTGCLSDITDRVNNAFTACGYEYSIVNKDDLKENKVYQKIISSIDKNIPVIQRKLINSRYEYSIICGYDDNNTYSIYILKGGTNQVQKTEFNDSESCIFIGNKVTDPNIKDVYRNLILSIPEYLNMSPKDGFIFGKNAFKSWADSLIDGRFDNMPLNKINKNKYHTNYLINAGTNGCARGALERTLLLNPDMIFIKKLQYHYDNMQRIFDYLAYTDGKDGLDYQSGGLHGGFKIEPKIFKNQNGMKDLSCKIEEFVLECDRILNIFDSLKN